ncbi:hypothetical protein EZV62_015946 [Acer yangbiense]|uniref:Magnesium transporter CorA-like family protein n=1 Tax=Acer yangbiense TaxID=1000413 RepID=A0A5C7HM64_9ROSI|nr:hypothetical protein EZV62_015946 [Acer yangbiense]
MPQRFDGSHWVPIGWARISELVQIVQVDGGWASQQLELMDDEDDVTVVDFATPFWKRPSGPIWWCHVAARPISGNNVLGITEVKELVLVGGYNVPRTVHEVIALLAYRLSRWDDRLFRKSIFGAVDEIELKFMNRRNLEDMTLFWIILSQEIRRLSRQVIRVKWSLHAREEIVFELAQHLRGNATRILLNGREIIEEQEAVRGLLFTIQDVVQSTVCTWLHDISLKVTLDLVVFGGGGLVLSIITGLVGINVDGIPGAVNTPYAFGLFAVVVFSIGAMLIIVGLFYLGLKKPVSEA